jgi:hypothetical protein
MDLPTLNNDLGSLVHVMYGDRVKVSADITGNMSIVKWFVDGVKQPTDLQAFFDTNSHLLVEGVKQQLRDFRSQILLATDWSQLADAPIDAATKLKYSTYRQALRDISKQPGFPNGVVVWPDVPAEVGAQLNPKSSLADIQRIQDVVAAQKLSESIPDKVIAADATTPIEAK